MSNFEIFKENNLWLQHTEKIVPNSPFEEYTNTPAYNFSSLSKIKKNSFKHFLHEMKFSKPSETRDMQFGRVLHEFVFEESSFYQKYYCPQTVEETLSDFNSIEFDEKELKDLQEKGVSYFTNGATKVGKKFKAYCESNNVGIISDKDFTLAKRIKSSIMENPILRKIMEDKDGHSEISLFWSDKEFGLPMKGRIDRLTPNLENDLKSCVSAHPAAVLHSVKKYLYHMQRALYIDGLAYHGIEVKASLMWFAEKNSLAYVQPYRVKVDSDEMRLGRKMYKDALRQVADYLDSGKAIGYKDWNEENKFGEYLIDLNIPYAANELAKGDNMFDIVSDEDEDESDGE